MSSVRGLNEGSSQRLASERLPLRWQCWPLRDDALRSALLLAGLAAVGLLVYWLTGQSHTALVAAGLLGATLWRHFVPSTYELSESGLERRVLGRRLRTAWRAIRRWEAGPDGVLLLARREPGLWGWCRAIYVPWGSRAEEVLERLRSHCPYAESPPRSPTAAPSAPEQPVAADDPPASPPPAPAAPADARSTDIPSADAATPADTPADAPSTDATAAAPADKAAPDE